MRRNNFKFKFVFFHILFCFTFARADSLSKNFSFSSGSEISSSKVNSNFDQIFSEINLKDTRLDTIEASNWVTTARIQDGAVTAAKLATGITVSAETTRTINLNNTMTAAQIQTQIDSISRYIPYGVTVTLQFADGVYTLNQTLNFKGFFGGGVLNINGNLTEAGAATLHTTQAVTLDFSAANNIGLLLQNNWLSITISNLKIAIKTDVNFIYGIYVRTSRIVGLNYNYIYGTSAAFDTGAIECHVSSSCVAIGNYVSNVGSGLLSLYGSVIQSQDNDDTGTMPRYGLSTVFGGLIIRVNTQPAGSVSNTINNTGPGVF